VVKKANRSASVEREAVEHPARRNRGFVTSADVARLAGVSRSAVSRTFTSGASVSEQTRQRVHDAANALGYRINRLAQSLIGDTSNLVGVVGANLAAPFMAAQLDVLSRTLLLHGQQTLLLNVAEGGDIEQLISLMLEFRVRAIVVMSGRPPMRIVEECARNEVRVILVNTTADLHGVDTVLIDDAAGGKLSADRLIAACCRSCAVVNGRPNTYNHKLRARSFMQRIEASGRPVRIWEADASDYNAGLVAAGQILAGSEIDGVFCTTDLTALGVMDGLRSRLGKRIPQDVSVIGFDDIPQASWELYQLTTVRQPIDGIVSAVMAVLERSGPKSNGDAPDMVPVELIERQTVKGS
jgi:DNA-binding LacI/PurR family transcriptional regulator